MSGGFRFGNLKDNLKIVEPVVPIKSEYDDKPIPIPVQTPIIIPSYTVQKKKKNTDPASKLRKLATKSKKIFIVGKGGYSKIPIPSVPSQSTRGSGLDEFLYNQPRRILKMISHLHKVGMLLPILKIGKHL